MRPSCSDLSRSKRQANTLWENELSKGEGSSLGRGSSAGVRGISAPYPFDGNRSRSGLSTGEGQQPEVRLLLSRLSAEQRTSVHDLRDEAWQDDRRASLVSDGAM